MDFISDFLIDIAIWFFPAWLVWCLVTFCLVGGIALSLGASNTTALILAIVPGLPLGCAAHRFFPWLSEKFLVDP